VQSTKYLQIEIPVGVIYADITANVDLKAAG
jgi:hypothetical protein